MFKLATDDSPGVRREVCIGFCQLISTHPELLEAQLPQLIEYMLVSNQDADDEVALEAAEFWLAFCESDLGMELLIPVLSRLIPLLMKNMVRGRGWLPLKKGWLQLGTGWLLGLNSRCCDVLCAAVGGSLCMCIDVYRIASVGLSQSNLHSCVRLLGLTPALCCCMLTHPSQFAHFSPHACPRSVPCCSLQIFDEYDEEVQAAEEAELQQGRPDSEQDIKPTHSKHGRGRGGSGMPLDGAPDGEAAEGEGDDDDEALRVWNLRKCSAAALDLLSNNLGDEHILPQLLPIVQQRLGESDWRVRESAILALGAVSEGCHMGLAPYLTDMVKMLIPVLQVRPCSAGGALLGMSGV